MQSQLQLFLAAFFSFKAYVMLPLIMLVIALAVGLSLKRALFSAVALAAGFAGVFIAFNFFVANISPAVEQLSTVRGLDFAVLDVGWPPLAAITWASPLAAISIPMVLLANILMLALGLTRTIYIDIWNYWHFALVGALVLATSGSMWLGLAATLLVAVYCFMMAQWSSGDIAREMGLQGVAASPLSVNGWVPYAAAMDWVFDRLPLIRRLDYNPQRNSQAKEAAQASRQGESPDDGLRWVDLLSEPMVIGLLMGLALALAAGYGLKETLELSVHIAAVMFLLPKSAGLIGEATMPITNALRDQVARRFPSRKNLIVALDTGFLMGHKSVVMTGLLLMALSILIALVLPGNKVLPLGDLPNLISIMSLSVLMFRGNVVRAVLAGVPVIIIFLLISSGMAPLFTELAHKTPSFEAPTAGLITAFTDGANPVRFIVYYLFQGRPWALALTALLALGCYVVWRRSRTLKAAL